jgi:hypothetical protein
MAGCCEYGDEPSDFIKRGEFLDYLKKDSCQEGLCSVSSLVSYYCIIFSQ